MTWMISRNNTLVVNTWDAVGQWEVELNGCNSERESQKRLLMEFASLMGRFTIKQNPEGKINRS